MYFGIVRHYLQASMNIAILISCLLSCILLTARPAATAPSESPEILIFNSYHKGYSWSDQLMSGIESTLLHQYPGATLRIEYMDTKRNTSATYFERLFALYQEKYRNPSQFDLIFATDDNAIDFLLTHGKVLFPDIPVIFCGANSIDTRRLEQQETFTGIMERAAIRQTLDVALQLEPDTEHVVIINDTTVTGRHVGKELESVLPGLPPNLSIEILPDLPLALLAQKVASLGNNSIILLLAYLRDNQGVYYDPQQTATLLSRASPVPIYSVWDFYFRHGITGGVLTSGYLQGEAAAEIGLKILSGQPVKSIPIDYSSGNQLFLDYAQMQRFGLRLEKAPREALVTNISYGDEKNVLMLHSYSPENDWTRSIMAGVEQTFRGSSTAVNVVTEFMDTKRHSDKPYLHSLATLFARKFGQTRFDLVMVSDDHAYDFVLRHRDTLFHAAPIVFCGVNYLAEPQAVLDADITGVLESYDILGTLLLGLDLFPKTNHLFIINDDSATGQANERRLNQILGKIPPHVTIERSGNISMQELLKRVSTLDAQSLVLLMSFTKDKNNHRFSFERSGAMITASASRPVLGFWDFYLKAGIVGGVITSGYEQGRTAAVLGLEILQGIPVAELPVVEASPLRVIVDYRQLKEFKADMKRLPAGTELLNDPYAFFRQYRVAVFAILTVFAILLVLVAIQAVKIVIGHQRQRSLQKEAENDPLTGAKTRKFMQRSLKNMIETSLAARSRMALCYFDLDNLKTINDTFGHQAGDRYIQLASRLIRDNIRTGDILCRVGGDEFIALLPDCSASNAVELCESINWKLGREELFDGFSLSISSGVSEFDPDKPVTAAELIATADEQMYRQKAARDRSRP